MNQLWNMTMEMFRLPFTAFNAGLEMFSQWTSAMLRPMSASAPATALSAGGGTAAVSVPIPQVTITTPAQEPREERPMADQDLSGKDVKYVNYTIYFTKRGYEAILDHQDEDVVWYETSGPSYAVITVNRWAERAAKGEVNRPASWPAEYPPKDPKLPKDGFVIPDNDRRFVEFSYHVVRRQPRREGEWEERQTIALEKIANVGVKQL